MVMSLDISYRLLHWLDANRALMDPFKLPKRVKKIRQEIREWVAKEVVPMADRIDSSAHDNFNWELLRKAAEAGYVTNFIPSNYGGSASMLDFVRGGIYAATVILEEISAACPGVANLIGAHLLGLLPIILSMDRKVAKRFLPEIGKAVKTDQPKICAFAITEPDAGSDVEDNEGGRKAHLMTFAKKVKGGYVLNGRKCFISNGSVAWLFTVFASLDREKGIDAWTCFVVTAGTKGFSVGKVEDKMGQRASPAAELILEDVFVPEENRVGKEGDGWLLNQMTLDYSRGPVGVIAIGAGRHALTRAIEYCRSKSINGKTMLEDRAVQAELADMLMKLEAARTLIWRATSTFPPLHYLSAMAKCFGSDVAMDICSRAIDLMGEEGTLRQMELEKAFRDIKLTQIYEGTNQVNRLAIAEELLLGNKLPWD
jgi:acyl-CoA dehydrogenase